MLKKVFLVVVFAFMISNIAVCAPKTDEQKECIATIKYMDYSYSPKGFELAVRKGRYDVVQLFLKSGMNPDTKYLGNPMTFVAIYFGKNSILDLLLEYEADINMKNPSWDLMSFAIYNGNIDAMRILIKYKVDVNKKYRNLTPVEFAVKQNNVEAVRILLDAGALVDKALYKRSRTNNNPMMRQLMKNAYDSQR